MPTRKKILNETEIEKKMKNKNNNNKKTQKIYK